MAILNLSDSKQTLLEQVKLFGRFNCDLRDTVVLFMFRNHKFGRQPGCRLLVLVHVKLHEGGVGEECLRIAVANRAPASCCYEQKL